MGEACLARKRRPRCEAFRLVIFHHYLLLC
jgi:hypothetical protein